MGPQTQQQNQAKPEHFEGGLRKNKKYYNDLVAKYGKEGAEQALQDDVKFVVDYSNKIHSDVLESSTDQTVYESIFQRQAKINENYLKFLRELVREHGQEGARNITQRHQKIFEASIPTRA